VAALTAANKPVRGSSAKKRASGRPKLGSSEGGYVHVYADLFTTIELDAIHIAFLVILITWLYRHVKREVQRND